MYELKELEREDIPIINNWRSSRDLINNLGAPYRYINKNVDLNWFDNYMLNRNNTIRCSVVDNNRKLLGLVSLTNINFINKTAVIHIMIGDSINREKGVGYFATKEILKHAFLDINLNRVELSVLESNNRALKLYNKTGFKKEGVKKEAVYKNGVFENMITMAILKEDFLKG